MAKTFLTNINLKGNQLLNAVIQPSATAPNALSAGQLYYNTQENLFYYSTGSGTGSWSAVGVQYIESVDSQNFNVSDKELYLNNTIVINLGATIGSSGNDGYLHFVNSSGDQYGAIELNGSDLRITSNSGIIQTNENEIQVQKTSYWRSGTQQGVIAAQSDGSLRLTGLTGGLQLESNSGDIKINSASGTTYFNNDIYINSEGTIGSESTDISLAPDSGRVNIQASTTIFGGDGDAFVRFQDSSNNDVIKINSGLASAEAYHGDNTYVNTKVVDINGFIKLSSENNSATGFLYVNAEGGSQEVPALHLESTGDLALRAGANGGQGNIILYTGATSSGTSGNVFIGYSGQNSAGANNQIATLGETETFSNKTLASPTITGTITFDNSSNTAVGTETISGANTFHIGSDYQVNIRSNPADIVLQADYNDEGADGNGPNGKVYYGWGRSSTNQHPEREVATVGTTQTFSNKTITSATLGGNLAAGGYAITGLADPTSSQDAATKAYVDATAQGLSILGSVRAASNNANFDITSPVPTVDGVTLADGDRVLLKDQSTATQNGIYIYNGTSGLIVPSTNIEDTALKEGSFVFVEEGSQGSRGYIVTNYSTGATTWTQFSAAGEYTASHGVTLSGNDIQLNPSSSGGLTVDSTYVSIKLQSDSGLATTSSGLAVGAGTGIAVSGSNVSIDTASGYGVRKYASVITGDDTTYDFTKQHNLNTKDVQVRVYQTSMGPDTQWADVEVDIVRDSSDTNNKVHVIFATPPASGTTYGVVIVG